jgi:hypothetical protein
MAKIAEIERKLLNWARWVHGAGSGGLGYARSNPQLDAARSGYREAAIPTSDCEASLTDMAVGTLDDRLRLTVRQVYLTGDSPAMDARALGCSETTVKERVWAAHRKLAHWFSDRDQVARTERSRVEALQREKRSK